MKNPYTILNKNYSHLQLKHLALVVWCSTIKSARSKLDL